MKRLIIIAVVFLMINSCSEESTMFDPTYFGDGFKGITFTAEDSPDPLKVDPTDWCTTYSNNFYKAEDDTSVDDEGNPIIGGVIFGAAFPNPININGSTTIPFSLPFSTNVYIYVVNSDYQIITVLVNDLLQAGSYQVQFDSKVIGVSGVYRVIFESEYFFCKGDVWIKGSGN
ncbi:hypothetical protein IT397_02715 [Candidatus Nomurabacteria bacterium]|nr:hypothetical protein [Candidatus Nomurabacteria bacterium]